MNNRRIKNLISHYKKDLQGNNNPHDIQWLKSQIKYEEDVLKTRFKNRRRNLKQFKKANGKERSR